MNEINPTRRTVAAALQVGDHLSRVQYYRVVARADEEGFVTVENTHGFQFKLRAEIVEAEMYSAGQYDREVRLTRSELAERLTAVGDTCFTVRFRKQVSERAVAARLAVLAADPASISDEAACRRLAKELLEGEERVLVGYLVDAQPRLGRSMVIDLDVEAGEHAIRMVDHRTISELITRNVRYFCD